MSGKPQELVRTLSVFQGTVLAVSLVIGSGVLGLPGIVLEEIGTRYAALSWILTAIAMIPFILVFSRLGTFFPSSPGLLTYSEVAFGMTGRYAASFILLFSLALGQPALLAIGGSFLQVMLGLGPKWVPILAVGILCFSVALNLMGLRMTAKFNTISVVIFIAFILILTVSKAELFVEGLEVGVASFGPVDQEGLFRLWKGSALLFWAFLGWESLSFGVQDIKNPKRAVPLIFGLSFVIVTALFWMPAFTSIGAAHHGMLSILGPAGLLSLVEGSFLKPLYYLALIFLVLGNANAWIYTSSRILLAEANFGILPRSWGALSDKNVPIRCLIYFFFGVLACIGVCWALNCKISSLILLVNQNFLFLFLASIWAYQKVETSRFRYLVTTFAFVTCLFFLSGFNRLIFLPIALFIAGHLTYLAKRRRQNI